MLPILLVVWIKFYGRGWKPYPPPPPVLQRDTMMKVSVRPPKHHYDVISSHCVFKLAYFIEHDIGYQPSKFQCSRMSGSNFMDGGVENPSPQCYNEIKKPSAYRVKMYLERSLNDPHHPTSSILHCYPPPHPPPLPPLKILIIHPFLTLFKPWEGVLGPKDFCP